MPGPSLTGGEEVRDGCGIRAVEGEAQHRVVLGGEVVEEGAARHGGLAAQFFDGEAVESALGGVVPGDPDQIASGLDATTIAKRVCTI